MRNVCSFWLYFKEVLFSNVFASCSCAFVTDFLKSTTHGQHSSLTVPCSLPGVGKFGYDIPVRRACSVMVYCEPLG